MKLTLNNLIKNYFIFFLIIAIINITNEGIIQPDDILPLEISPPYRLEIGKTGTKFIFRFYIPNNLDKNGMPTLCGYGAGNGQYIGISFNIDNDDLFNPGKKHSCLMSQTDNSLDIPLLPFDSEDSDKKTIYCKINSFDNTKVMLPGYNYKLTITITSGIPSLDDLASITIFTTPSPKSTDVDIFDIGTFNHINIFHPYNNEQPLNVIASLVAINSDLNVEVETYFSFSVKITFNDWFSWDNYVICIDLPKNQVNTENPTMTLSKASEESNVGVPTGTIYSINLETTEERKIIGFYLDGSSVENFRSDILLMNFSGLATKEAGLIREDDQGNNKIGIEIRYRNSYVVCARKQINFQISLGNVKFSVKHPETNILENYVFDVFRGGAFQIEFTINSKHNIKNKYFVIRQKDSKKFKRVTFIASSCDFSDFDISSANFTGIPKCHPIQNKNNNNNINSEDNFNGIFFYYPYVMKANNDYKLRIWMFFDECGPDYNNNDEVSSFDGEYSDRAEIFFYLEIYNNINKNKFGGTRIESKNIFLNKIPTENGITCYNTYMGDKTYNNGYAFNMDSYTNGPNKKKLLYREYFNWNVYNNIDRDTILGNLFEADNKTPKFIYSSKGNLIKDSNILLVNKITLDTGNNEQLGQFFPMGLQKNPIGGEIGAIKGRFFTKLSKNFFEKSLDSKGETAKCYVSWAFGSPSILEEGENLHWKPKAKYYPMQKYNFISNSRTYFEDLNEDSAALFDAHISNDNIKDYYLFSDLNKGWDKTANEAEWGFGDDETLEDRIGDSSPEYIYFGFADTCHHWNNTEQKIYSLYTPIEIIIGITGEDGTGYSRVMRFIKLYPEGGVWHDNIVNEGEDIFVRSNDFIITNHFAYNKDVISDNDENRKDEKGVCLLEIKSGVLDSQRALSSNFFLWIFMGSLLDTEYEQISANYPVGNLKSGSKAYGYSSQHSLHLNNFYAKPSSEQNSDINTPLYNLATSMNSIHQTATTNYLFYLGSLIVFYNKVKSNSFYDNANDPLLIPYYCPYYPEGGSSEPYSLGIFPSIIAGFGSFNSMTDLGNKGLEKIVAKKINNKQLNVLMLSGIKIYQTSDSGKFKHYYNTIKFINDYSNSDGKTTLNVWNSDVNNNPCDNEYDSIDSFIFFFNSKLKDINKIEVIPQANIPSQLKSLSKTKELDNCFYVYGKQFCSGIFGITNSDLLLTQNTPTSRDKTPYLSIKLNLEISEDITKCESSNDFCQKDIIGYWGISSNHDMIQYVTNYNTDSFLLDYNIYRTYFHNKIPKIELGQELAFTSDTALVLKITFYTPFKNAISSNTILYFNIKDVTDAKCSVQSSDVNLPANSCSNPFPNDEKIKCQLIDSSMEYNIFCYKLNYGSKGRFTVYDFKLYLPGEDFYSDQETLIFEDSNEYSTVIDNINKEINPPTIEGKYVTNPFNEGSYSKLELKIDLKREAHPGMIIKITFDKNFDYSFNEEGKDEQCKLSLSRINPFSLNDTYMKDFWTVGNSLISNCKVNFDASAGTEHYYIITATLEDKIYKAGKKLSNIVYIYIWPFKTINLVGKSIDLSIEVNERSIISPSESEDGNVYFSSINQNIYGTSASQKTNIITNINIIPKIYGALADYIFSFDLTGVLISLVQIFFPKEITFECEECVKCYELSGGGSEANMITCNFEDTNILNIFFSQGNSQPLVLVTGIINPRTSIDQFNLYFNLISINSGNRVTVFNSFFELEFNGYLTYTNVHGLRFFYAKDYVLDKNPRAKAENKYYKFRIGLDCANREYTVPKRIINDRSLIYIYFPRDYHLYINDNPVNAEVYQIINNARLKINTEAKLILGRKIQIKLVDGIDTITANFQYIEIIIYNIKNPNKIISSTGSSDKSKHTGYFEVVIINSNSDYYYTTGINSNTYRTDFIKDNSARTSEYNWYRGNLVETENNNKNKLVVDVLYNEKTYNFIFLQPGRYKKVYFLTSSDDENTSNFYLNPNSTSISFPSSDIVKTLEESYILPSLYGEPYEFYIGVPCNTNEGIYVVSPTISNSEQYIDPPSIIVYVRQIEAGKIEFNKDDLGIFPKRAKGRVYYYLTDINVDEFNINWIASDNYDSTDTKIDVEQILIPGKTITNKTKKISNIFSTITIKQANDNTNYNYLGSISEKCYQLSPENLVISQMSSIEPLNIESILNYDLKNDLIIKNSDNDKSLLSNEIKFQFSSPTFQPAFIICELYCPYKKEDDKNKLLFFNFNSMNAYINTVQTSYFRKYSSNYFMLSCSEGALIFSDVIKGYQYNAQCIYQTTHSETASIQDQKYTLISDNLHSTYPTTTRCNTFYFISPIDEEIQQKYINYCQYIIGKSFGYGSSGCIICSDVSGKIIAPGYSLFFPFDCQSEKCYDKSNSDLIEEMYRLSEDFNSKSKTSKYEFTICATSNRICSSQITEKDFNSVFNEFVNNVKISENVNKLFDIDYNDIKYIIYNGFYQNSIFIEDNIKEDDISIEFISQLNKNGTAVWKAYYNSEVNFNVLCFWRIKISTDQTPTMEEMTNCVEDDTFCGIFVANYGGHEYQIPDNKRSDVVVGEYSMYITCSHFVPSPVYFTSIKNVITMEIKEESFSGKKLIFKYINLFLFLISLI